jgi:hypothetical protein
VCVCVCVCVRARALASVVHVFHVCLVSVLVFASFLSSVCELASEYICGFDPQASGGSELSHFIQYGCGRSSRRLLMAATELGGGERVILEVRTPWHFIRSRGGAGALQGLL